MQDELGIIFIYNTSTSEIEKEISFAGAGDYEGLSIAGETAFVLRSDGTISAINIHPQTRDIYIADAKDPKILIMNPQGEIQSLHPLSRNDFAQAEGIAFSPSGELYISNEGKKGTANILKVRLGSNQ